MSIRSTLIVATAIATLVGSPAFAQGFDDDSGNRRPSYYTSDGARHMGRPPQQQPVARQPARHGRGLYLYAPGANDPPASNPGGMSKEMMQNDWWWGGANLGH